MNATGEMNMDKQYAGRTGSLNAISEGQAGQPRQPALGGLYDALKQMSEAVVIARNVADQLCGSAPEGAGEKDAPQSSSYFGQLDDIAGAFRAQANRITSDMQRILGKI